MRKGDDAGEPIVAFQPDSRVAREFVKVAENVMRELKGSDSDIPTDSES